jgi:hypothetical protein
VTEWRKTSSDLKPEILSFFLKKFLPFLQTEAEKSLMDKQEAFDRTKSVRTPNCLD